MGSILDFVDFQRDNHFSRKRKLVWFSLSDSNKSTLKQVVNGTS